VSNKLTLSETGTKPPSIWRSVIVAEVRLLEWGTWITVDKDALNRKLRTDELFATVDADCSINRVKPA